MNKNLKMKTKKYKPDTRLIIMSYFFAYIGSASVFLKIFAAGRGGFQFSVKGTIAVILGIIFILLSVLIMNKFEKYYDEYMEEYIVPVFHPFKKSWKYVLVIILLSFYPIKISSSKTVFNICHVIVILLVIISMAMTEYNMSKKKWNAGLQKRSKINE